MKHLVKQIKRIDTIYVVTRYSLIIVVIIFILQSLTKGAYESYSLQQVGLTGFIAWVGTAVSHYRFRRAFDKQNSDKI